MAREKGTGNLQCEKSGRWTVRIGINGKRLSRSARTTDKDKAEAFLNRMLAPLGLGTNKLPLGQVWAHYEMSPSRRDLERSTLLCKRGVWMRFARWIETYHPEIIDLAQVTSDAIAEYLRQFRANHSASTYNTHVCILREVFRVLADKAGLIENPWADVRLRADDSMPRRELTLDEVERLHEAAIKQGPEWDLLILTGVYTGLRLGDCCRLKWSSVNLETSIIQLIPSKTKKHAHGKPVTIPIHPKLRALIVAQKETLSKSSDASVSQSPYVNPIVAETYISHKWKIDAAMREIFKAANVTMSARVEGRTRKVVIASFHSLRHTFVSFAANAGVPLPVVQSIVGHTSTAMTRHYYHENEEVLRRAVEAIPAIGQQVVNIVHPRQKAVRKADALDEVRVASNVPLGGLSDCLTEASSSPGPFQASPKRGSIAARLQRLGRLLAKGIITQEEYATQRTRILSEL